MFLKTLTSLTAAATLGLAAPAALAEDKPKDIVDTAVSAGTFETLVAAVGAAGLVETLKGEGPFTVFAPTDEAFAALPEGTVESLLKPENKDTLVAVLTYHVIAGQVAAADAIKLDGKSAKTVQGSDINISVVDGKVKINDATVIAADVKASNGIIHVIDKVLLPPTPEAQADRPMPTELIELIELAIDHGAPLYNHGQKAACAAIYEVTLTALQSNDQLGDMQRTVIAQALETGEHTRHAGERAWVYRRALDKVHHSMDKMMAMNTP